MIGIDRVDLPHERREQYMILGTIEGSADQNPIQTGYVLVSDADSSETVVHFEPPLEIGVELYHQIEEQHGVRVKAIGSNPVASMYKLECMRNDSPNPAFIQDATEELVEIGAMLSSRSHIVEFY